MLRCNIRMQFPDKIDIYWSFPFRTFIEFSEFRESDKIIEA